MSSTNSSEKPSTSSAAQKVKAKAPAKAISSSQALDAMDKRLDLLLSRVATLENSLNQLTTTFCNNDSGEDEAVDDDLDLNKEADLKDDEVSDDDTLVEVSKLTAEIEHLDLDNK